MHTWYIWKNEVWTKLCTICPANISVNDLTASVASADESILVAIERAGISAPSRCRSGECGWCRSKLLEGDVFIPEDNDGRRYADRVNGYIHPCSSFPVSDIVIEVPGSEFD